MPQRVPNSLGPNHCVRVLETEGQPIDWKHALTANINPNKKAELQQPTIKLVKAAQPNPIGIKKRALERSHMEPLTNLKKP